MQDVLAMNIDVADVIVMVDDDDQSDNPLATISAPFNDHSTDIGEESTDSVIDKPWLSEKCVSCCTGFNKKSPDPITCDGCDLYTHKKQACVEECRGFLYCTSCFPRNGIKKIIDKDLGPDYSRVENGFKCNICSLVVRTKFSIRRHLIRKHKKHQYRASSVTKDKNDLEYGNDNTGLPKFWFRPGRLQEGGDRPTPGKQSFIQSNIFPLIIS